MAFPAILCAKALGELPGFVLQAPAGPSEGHFWAGSAPQGGCAHPAPRALGLEAECGAPSVGLPSEAWQGWLIQFQAAPDRCIVLGAWDVSHGQLSPGGMQSAGVGGILPCALPPLGLGVSISSDAVLRHIALALPGCG